MRDGVTPKVVKGGAFCGEGSLYMNNAWGMISNAWRRDLGKDAAFPGASEGTIPFGTTSFPYICMAYRIPPTTVLSFMIRIVLRNQEGVLTGHEEWRTIYLTNTRHSNSYPKVGVWSVLADDEWHYDCLDLQYMLDNAAEEDDKLFRGQDHLIEDIIFWTDEVSRSSYAANEFYIDEFCISKTPRVVRQTSYPQVAAFHPMMMFALSLC